MIVNRVTLLNQKKSNQPKTNYISKQNQLTFTAYQYKEFRNFSHWFVDWLRKSPSRDEIATHLRGIANSDFRHRREVDINAITEILETKEELVDIGAHEIDQGRRYSSDIDYELQNHEDTPEPENYLGKNWMD